MSRSLMLQQLYESDLTVQKIVDSSDRLEITDRAVPVSGEEFRRAARALEASKFCRYTQRHPNTGNVQRIKWFYTNIHDVAQGRTPFLYPAPKSRLPRGSMRIDCVLTPEMLKEVAYDLREQNPTKDQVQGWLERLLLTYFDRRKPHE